MSTGHEATKATASGGLARLSEYPIDFAISDNLVSTPPALTRHPQAP